MLEVRDLNAWYGKSHVLRGASFRVGEGEIVGLLGRNGAGRSTAVKAVMGEVPPRGSVRFKGEEIAGRSSFEIARRGLGHVPESRDIFPTLTVRQNLLLGMKSASASGRWSVEEVFRMFPNLAERAEVRGGALSGGEQQMLSICRALMGDPDMLMVDEPTEGLAPKIVGQVADLLREIAGRGTAVLLVEQKLAVALGVSRRLYVMGRGRMVWEGAPDELAAAGDVRAEWLEV